MSPTPTTHVETVDFVMLYIVGISVVLLLGITATMIYFVFKYHRKKGHQPVDIHGNMLLEVIWIAIPTVLVLSMFYFGYTGFRELRDIPKNAFKVNVEAMMWKFTFKYANGKQADTLYVPVKTPIHLEMKSVDVNHAFFIPAFRIKEDVLNSQFTNLYFNADNLGVYDVACAEYCGLKHSMMYTAVKVLPKDEFDNWYNTKATPANAGQDSTKIIKK